MVNVNVGDGEALVIMKTTIRDFVHQCSDELKLIKVYESKSETKNNRTLIIIVTMYVLKKSNRLLIKVFI